MLKRPDAPSSVRPWNLPADAGNPDRAFGPQDCFLRMASATSEKANARINHAELLSWTQDAQNRALHLLPYPKLGQQTAPLTVHGLPKRPPLKADLATESPDEKRAVEALGRMNQVIARMQELGEALDDPEHLWQRLSVAWDAATLDDHPRMAEIVRQARHMDRPLRNLENRIRRVLRRARELTPLDRVQEMDRASMLWLARQPGRSTAERAGAHQRVMSIVRQENFDTLENRVLHSYAALAANVARSWQREHPRARNSARYLLVDTFRKKCLQVKRRCTELDIRRADATITPNYVLMEDRDYRSVYKAWVRLLKQEKEIDDLWAWQAESWTDFCIVAVTLALHDLPDSELVAQAPILWNGEAVAGRWFRQTNPLAVFWLRNSNAVVEVQARPSGVSSKQAAARAHVWLKISDLTNSNPPQRVPIWTLHAFEKPVVSDEVEAAALTLAQTRQIGSDTQMSQGLVLSQAFNDPDDVEHTQSGIYVRGISFDAESIALKLGREALGQFMQRLLQEPVP